MKRTITSVIALIIFSFSCIAENVPANVTRQAAVNFWNTYRPEKVLPISIDKPTLLTFAELPMLHIYAVDDQGFVILSAYDGVQPVLGYSFDSPASDDLNPETGYWLRWFNYQITVAKDENYSTDDARTQWNNLLTAPVPPSPVSIADVPAMLTTRWNQSSPYNKLCPWDDRYHERTVVGCVATAMAQIMKYWNHPSSGTGSHTYTHHGMGGGQSYGELSADFENSTYIWSYMPDQLGMVVGSDEEINSVALISYHCGVAVDMMYGPSSTGGSGAYSSCGSWTSACAEHAFFDYFKYSPETHFVQRLGNIWYNGGYVETHYYSDSAWMAMIDASLAEGQPMYYSGSDSTGGHAFVCDGSDLHKRYHFNWGWGGSYDGFYAINDLSPRSGGVGGNATYTFNHSQGAIFGIVPVEEHFDSVTIYDTTCRGMGKYHFHDYSFPAKDDTLTAVWCGTVYTIYLTVINSRTVYIDPNGGSGIVTEASFCPNVGLVFPECRSSRSGYNFIGWGLKRNGNDVIYQPGDTLNARNSLSIYAQWRDTNYQVGVETVDDGQVQIYPSPTRDRVNISVENSAEAEVSIIDSYGRVLINQKTIGGKAKISLRRLPAGTYTVMVMTSDEMYKQRIIKL